MFQKPVVRNAFHMSWFLLTLGGASLLERKYLGIPGGIMLLFGLGVALYTLLYMYLKRKPSIEPIKVLLASNIMLAVLVLTHLIFRNWMLSLVLLTLSLPVLFGWLYLKNGGTKKSKKA
ncbi:MAG: hypothetical protein IT244_06170 [Bacteroidia bacterium]|nr:hypothetical protein [Bacteroidia bacterium]